MAGRRLAVAALCALLLPSCSRTMPWERKDPEVEVPPVIVHVENQNFNDATIYAIVRSSRVRLGQVAGHAQAEFEVPFRPTDLAFDIDLLAGRTFRTGTVLVSPGDEVFVVITADLRGSRVYR